MKASFILRQNGRLGDKRPLDALRNGEIEAVERAPTGSTARSDAEAGAPDLDRKGVAIFDREGIAGAARSNGRGSLMDPGNVDMLGKILDEYDFGLIPRWPCL